MRERERGEKRMREERTFQALQCFKDKTAEKLIFKYFDSSLQEGKKVKENVQNDSDKMIGFDL